MTQRYLFLDTETTGLDPTINEVIEVGAIVYEQGDNDEQPKELCRYVCKLRADQGEVDLGALQVNQRRLTEDLVFDSVITADIQKDIVFGLADFLASEVTKNTFVIGANIQFDIEFIKSLLKRYGIESKELFSKNKLIDIQQVARFLDDAGVIDVPNFRLGTLYKNLTIVDRDNGPDDFYQQHTAMADVLMTSNVYFRLRDLL